MELVYVGKLSGIAVGPYRLPRGETVLVEDEETALFLIDRDDIEESLLEENATLETGNSPDEEE